MVFLGEKYQVCRSSLCMQVEDKAGSQFAYNFKSFQSMRARKGAFEATGIENQ